MNGTTSVVISLDDLRQRSSKNNWLANEPGGWITLDVSPETLHRGVLERASKWKSPVHEKDFLFFANFRGLRGTLADIGANMGQSALSIRNVNKDLSITSFEINPLLFPVLEQWTRHLSDFKCFNFGLSDSNEDGTLFVPVFDKFLCTPLGSLMRDAFDSPLRLSEWKKQTQRGSFELLALDIKLRRFDDFNLPVDFVKIDVEGAEIYVLKGMSETLVRCRPVIMCERSNDRSFIDFMHTNGFDHYSYNDETNTLRSLGSSVGTSLNIFFVHKGKRDFVAAHGVSFL